MAYTSWSVSFGEQPSATKWNQLGSNDASFNDGTGIGDGAIATRSLATGSVTSTKLAPTLFTNYSTSYPSVTSSSYTDVTGSSFSITTSTNATKYIIWCFINYVWTGTPSVETKANLVLNGSQLTESRIDAAVTGSNISHVLTYTGTIAAGTYTLKNQIKAGTGTMQVYDNRCLVMLLNS